MSATRPGFGLAETIVALVILATGVLGGAALTNAAAVLLRAAALEEAAVDGAAALLDSLLLAGADEAGERSAGPITYLWSARTGAATEAVVIVRFPVGAQPHQLLFSALAPAP